MSTAIKLDPVWEKADLGRHTARIYTKAEFLAEGRRHRVDGCMVDTGARRSILARHDWEKLSPKVVRNGGLTVFGSKEDSCDIGLVQVRLVDESNASPWIELHIWLTKTERVPTIIGMDILSQAVFVCQRMPPIAYLLFPGSADA